jgi:CBS domain containing-hemolysin-like protein
MSSDEVGLVLVGLTIFFAVLGYSLSRVGLAKVSTTADAANAAAKEAKAVVADAQQAIAQQTGGDATEVAANTATVAIKTSVISDQITQVNDALAGLTGNQAPARVAWALCALCLVGAFVAFDLISVAAAPEADAPTS